MAEEVIEVVKEPEGKKKRVRRQRKKKEKELPEEEEEEETVTILRSEYLELAGMKALMHRLSAVERAQKRASTGEE